MAPSLDSTIRMAAQIAILTGERGVGKSTVCQKLAALAQARGYTCAGIITVQQAGDARVVLDVRSGALRPLTVAPAAAGAVVQGRFRFDPETLAWGGEVLAHATPCDLLIVDELGPLELERGHGWRGALDVLAAGGYTLAVVVVRPELAERVQRRFASSLVATRSVTRQNRVGAPMALLALLEDAHRAALAEIAGQQR